MNGSGKAAGINVTIFNPRLDGDGSIARAFVANDPDHSQHKVCMSDRSCNTDMELYDAADEHARYLHRAQRHIEAMLNLAGVLRASIGDEGDRRAMQADAMLTIVERKVSKALNQLDRHDSRHMNLFFAYFDSAGAGGRGRH